MTEMNLAELVLVRAREDPHAVALRMDGASVSYERIATESERVAAGLFDLGVTRGDRVMMFAENSTAHLITYLAVARLGAVFTPIHPSFQAAELDYVFVNSAPRVVVADPALLSRLSKSGSCGLPAIQIVLGSAVGDAITFDSLGTGCPSPGIADVRPNEPVLICYTSGTTDRPHPVARSHDHEIWNAQTYADIYDFGREDTALVAMPLSWVWGLSSSCLALLSAGATVVLHREFESAAAVDEIEASQVTLFAGTMSMFTAMLGSLKQRPRDLSSLRHLYRGGEPLNNDVARQVEDLTGLRLYDAYASTEASPVLAVDPVRDLAPPQGTAGRLVKGVKIRLVDESGADVPRGQAGEAIIGGRGIMLGYWNEPDLTAARLTPDGWFRSGDLLIEDEDGYYYVVGRSGDLIIRNGARVAPAEVESALTSLPGVRDAVATGIPDEEFGESIVAFVLLEPGTIVSVDDVYAQLSGRIARYKIPSEIRFVDDLPMLRNAKRDRRALRQQALELLAQPTSRLRIVG
jgi:long-chain acyl-CoA synthetase